MRFGFGDTLSLRVREKTSSWREFASVRICSARLPCGFTLRQGFMAAPIPLMTAVEDGTDKPRDFAYPFPTFL
jgi:hypothetical protein